MISTQLLSTQSVKCFHMYCCFILDWIDSLTRTHENFPVQSAQSSSVVVLFFSPWFVVLKCFPDTIFHVGSIILFLAPAKKNSGSTWYSRFLLNCWLPETLQPCIRTVLVQCCVPTPTTRSEHSKKGPHEVIAPDGAFTMIIHNIT